MARMPRLAVGMAQSGIDARPILWALSTLLDRRIGAVQPFFGSARHDDLPGTVLAASRPARHLDSWIMSRPACRQFFYEGMEDARLGLLIGEMGQAPEPRAGSDWHVVSDSLDCPRIAVVDVSRLDGCNLPRRPRQVDAILLDGPRDLSEACRWQVNLETVWQAPVIGWLDELPPLRAIATHLRPGVKPGAELCRGLASNLSAHFNRTLLDRLLDRKPFFPKSEAMQAPERAGYLGSCRIALALDDAFSAYHAESLEWLAGSGAEIVDFSPLKDGSLPDQVDLVYLGASDLTPWLEKLSTNHCMHHALRTFAARGGRVYAEGPAGCYLGRTAQVASEQPLPMAGLLPLKSKRLADAQHSPPVEVVTSHECWLAPAGTRLRGYRSGLWQMEPAGPMLTYCTRPEQRCTLIGRNNVIVNQAALHLAAVPGLLSRFFKAGAFATVSALR